MPTITWAWMLPEDVPDTDADEEDGDGPSAPPVGALRALGELLAALLTVAAVLAALLIGAFVVQWMFR
jgi:hypothetical protein